VQIDGPFLPDIFFEVGLDDVQKKRRAQMYIEAINTGLKGIPAERVRFHTCYRVNEGPRIYEATLADIIEYVLKIDAGSFSFEAANPRHEHEYHLFEYVKVPDGKVLVPGVITHARNIVEHPELIAERIIRFARLVGGRTLSPALIAGFRRSFVQDRSAPDGSLGEIQSHARRRGHRHTKTLGLKPGPSVLPIIAVVWQSDRHPRRLPRY
jgi:5-methyltetrahydropteroyltriglutamate--homocysteine methyltransferase